MAKNLVDVDAFPTVNVPEDADPRNALSVEIPFQHLANRTHYLNLRKASLAGGASFTGTVSAPTFNYDTPISVQKTIPTLLGRTITGTNGIVEVANGIAWQFTTNNGSAMWPVMIPHGSTITAISAVVNHGNAGASGQMSMELWGMLNDLTDGDDNQIGSTRTFVVGTGYKSESINPVSGNVATNALTQYYVRVNASALATTNDDYLYALSVTCTVPGLVSR